MSQRVEKLQLQNAKLRDEIRNLQFALQDISQDVSITSSPLPKKSPNKQFISQSDKRRQLMKEIGQKADKRLHDYPKEKQVTNKENHKNFIASFGDNKYDIPPRCQNHIVQELESIQVGINKLDPDYNDSDIRAELGMLKHSLDRIDATLDQDDTFSLEDTSPQFLQFSEEPAFTSPKKPIQSQGIEDMYLQASQSGDIEMFNQIEEKPKSSSRKVEFQQKQETKSPMKNFKLKESFGSFYKSNNDTSVEKSFDQVATKSKTQKTIPAKRTVKSIEKSNTFDQHNTSQDSQIIKEIQALRKENQFLRNQLRKKSKSPMRKNQSRSRSRTPRRNSSKNIRRISKSPSRSPLRKPINTSLTRRPSRSPSATSINNLTPRRQKHCSTCDHLLSKGFSTVYCSKHGNTVV